MKTVVGRMIGGGGARALSLLAWGSSLDLDGILMIRGMSMAGARVIIVTPDEEPRTLTTGLAHFSLHLKLNTDYLLSFERPGCVSKQLQFNTAVPDGYPVGEGFYFPFQVTLEPMPKGQEFAYAGPVGLIHFDQYINAFGYDTDYRVTKNEVLAKRLELARTGLEQQAEPVRGEAAVPMPGSSGNLSGKGVEAPDTPHDVLAPVVSRTAPRVHVLEMPKERLEPVPAHSASLHVALDEFRPSRPGPELLALGAAPAKNELNAPVAMSSDRWKVVHADRLHVITSIKVQEKDREVEYRRVVSYYGGITFFRDGFPCSEKTYEDGSAR
ncbi:MAG: hypothetical protein IPH00_01045 [Flavobacteriales bacterium]|nr:hypothetical protein [Flavobacteriales bacterium]